MNNKNINVNMDIKYALGKSLDASITKSADLSTKYKLNKDPIGKGAFSTVYYARNNKLDEFAIKRILLSELKEARIDKFHLELNISLTLDHPNIVKCYETFETPTSWYIVTEYCNYGTFHDLIEALQKVEPKRKETLCKYYLTQLKNSLHYLHKRGIIHRDLKPMNILMTKTRETKNDIIVKLADFGFARYFDKNVTNTLGYDDMISTICGSPIYMAPELLIDGRYNTKADMWSFGIIMYELLYGTNPYNYPKKVANLVKLMTEKPIPYEKKFSSRCIDLMKQLLQIDPTKRITWDAFFDHQWFHVSSSQPDDADEIFKFDDDKLPAKQIEKKDIGDTKQLGPAKKENKLIPLPQINEIIDEDLLTDSTKEDQPKNDPTVGSQIKENPEDTIGDDGRQRAEKDIIENKYDTRTSGVLSDYVDDYFSHPDIAKHVATQLSDSTLSDYIVIDKTQVGTSKHKVYEEAYTSSLIKILTSSINFMFGHSKSY